MEHTKGKLTKDGIFITIIGGNNIAKAMFAGAKTNHANAEHIVKTWNSHDELLEALERSIRLNESLVTWLKNGSTQEAAIQTIRELNEAINNAK